jgi:hypothetical protein
MAGELSQEEVTGGIAVEVNAYQFLIVHPRARWTDAQPARLRCLQVQNASIPVTL